MDLKNFNIYFLIVLIPPLLVTGPFLPDLFLVILVFYFLFKNNNLIISNIKNFFFLKLLFFFSFYNIVISIFSEYPLFSLKSSVGYIRFLIFILVFIYVFKHFENIKKLFFYVLLASIIIVSTDAIFQFFFKFNFLGWPVDSKGRISGLFGSEYILGSYLTRCIPIFISLFFYFKEKKIINLEYKFLYLTFFISYFAILISGERTAFIMINMFLFLYIFFVLNLSIKKKFFYFIAVLSIVILAIFSSKDLNQRFVKLTLHNLGINSEDQSVNKLFSYNDKDKKFFHQNIKHLIVAKEIFLEKPIFGSGNKMFGRICFDRYFVDDGRCSTHPHNFLAQILVESGIIGGVIYLTVFLILLKNFIIQLLIKNKENKPILIILIGCLISLFPLIPSGNFYNNWLSINIYLQLSLYMYYKFELIKNKN